MNKSIVVAVVLGLVAVVGTWWYIADQKSSDTAMMEQKSVSEKASMGKEVVMKKDETSVTADVNGKAQYVEYTKEVLDQSVDKRRVLFFYANWCPICRPADADFRESVSKIPADVVLIRVNYNDPDTDQEEKDLAKKYGVTYQHTFVQIDKGGIAITSWNGGKTEELLKNIK